jgi:CO/xanthine dehydrogenase FAD-binding subunit
MNRAHARTEFSYVAPDNLDAALAELEKSVGATIIAGGTDLLTLWRAGVIQPDLLIDLKSLGMSYIRSEEDHVRIGAYTTLSELIASKQLAENFPILIDACSEIAAPPIRNQGTLGGNLVNASPAADTAPPLLVYDAEVVLVKREAQRVVALEAFFTETGETVKERNEILTEVRIPLLQHGTTTKFIKIGKRKAMAIAVASVATRIMMGENGEVLEARIALGSVAPIPLRARKAESVLEGSELSDEIITLAANKARDEASPISDIRASFEYRSRMVKVLVQRALKSTWEELRREGFNA